MSFAAFQREQTAQYHWEERVTVETAATLSEIISVLEDHGLEEWEWDHEFTTEMDLEELRDVARGLIVKHDYWAEQIEFEHRDLDY